MLKISECFENNVVERLRESINNIKKEDCVSSFVNYIDDACCCDDSIFENRYRKKLADNAYSVILDVIMKRHEKDTKEELLAALREQIYDYDGCLRADCENYTISELFDYWPISDIEAYDVIKLYMHNTLNELICEENKTEKQKKY